MLPLPEPAGTKPSSQAEQPRGRRPVRLASLAVLLTAADTYVVVLALPDIMAGVGLGVEELHRASAIISVFLLGYVTMLPLVGRLADLRGRVPVLVGCLLVFAAGSLFTATAEGLAEAVVGRGLQGVGAGGVVPATLALVADHWPVGRRGLPLGVVGAVQEAGSVLGPLYGAAVLAVSGWRAIFWVNLVGGAVLAGALAREQEPRLPRTDRAKLVRFGLAAAAAAAVALAAAQPAALASHLTLGALFVPTGGSSRWTSPLALTGLALAVLVAGLGWQRARRGTPPWRDLDLLGAGLLALSLAGVVLAFAAADPSRQAIADNGPELLALSAAAAGLFAVRQRRARSPLLPLRSLSSGGARGAMLVNLFVGAALVVALVDVPLFALATRYPDSQFAAALVLVQLLAALPVGAVAGGWALSRFRARWIATAGLVLCTGGFAAMASWDERALYGAGASAALVVTGLGFGLAVAPVNAVLLAATDAAVHGVASAFSVVARSVGMLVGLSVLSAVGLRVFYRDQAEIGTPLELCPESPGQCPVYEEATRLAVVHELSVMFWGAALCAAAAAILAALFLSPRTSGPGSGRGRGGTVGAGAAIG